MPPSEGAAPAPTGTAAPAAPPPSAPEQAGAPAPGTALRGENDFFAGAPAPAPEGGEPPEPQEGAGEGEGEPQDRFAAWLATLTPEQRAAAEAAGINDFRSAKGRLQVEAQARQQYEQASSQNLHAAQGWKTLATMAIQQAKAAGIDTSQLEQMAGAGGQAGEGDDGVPQPPMSYDAFAKGAGELFGARFDEAFGDKWQQQYDGAMDQVQNLLRLQRKAAEDGDAESARAFAAQARAATRELQRGLARTAAETAMAPMVRLLHTLAGEVAHLSGDWRGQQEQAEVERAVNQRMFEAVTQFGLQQGPDGRLKYPGFFEPNTTKIAASAKPLATAMRDWCARYGADMGNPQDFDEAYHAVLRKNHSLATRPATASAGARTPGGDAALGGGAAPLNGRGGRTSNAPALPPAEQARLANLTALRPRPVGTPS